MIDAATHARFVHNEQMKLAATLFNNVAVAFIVTGLIVPIIALAYQTTVPRGHYLVAYAVLWLVTAGLNHLIGRMMLSRMKP